MGIKIEFDADDLSGFTPLEPGIYPAKVYKVEVKTSQKSGQQYLAWEFILTDGSKRHLWLNTSLQKQALWRLARILAVFGVLPDGEFEFKSADFVNRECALVVKQREYRGKIVSDVVDVLPADAALQGDGVEDLEPPF